MLWWGWLGFNSASVPSFVSMPAVAAKVMGVTIIGGSSGGIASLLLFKLKNGYWDVGNATNGILTGLVSITAGGGTYEPEGAFVVGLVGGLIYVLSSNFLVRIRVRVCTLGRGGERRRSLCLRGGMFLPRPGAGIV